MLELREYSWWKYFLIRLRDVSFFEDDGDFSVEIGLKKKRPLLKETIKAPSRVVLLQEIRNNIYDSDEIEIILDPDNERIVKIFLNRKR